MSDWRQRSWPFSLQLIGSRGLGGAERWYQRFCNALGECGAVGAMGLRAGSGLDLDCRPRSDLAPAPAPAALPCYRLPFRTVWDPFSRGAVGRLLQRLRPEIVQTYMGRATRLTRCSSLRGQRPIHLARLGGYYALGPYRHADAWVGNTRGLCDWMIANGLPAGAVHHIYNFVEPAPVLPEARITALREQLGLEPDERVLVTLGRFFPFKGHRDLLEAMARLPRTIDERRWRLLLLGTGPLESALRGQAQDLGLADRVLWLGWQQDPQPYLQLCDLVVFPSLEQETLGNVILEAWASERPIVTTAFRGAREILRHGEDGWAVPCEDAVALGQGIEQALREPAQSAAWVQRGRERIAREFSRDAVMAQYQELYSTLANG